MAKDVEINFRRWVIWGLLRSKRGDATIFEVALLRASLTELRLAALAHAGRRDRKPEARAIFRELGYRQRRAFLRLPMFVVRLEV